MMTTRTTTACTLLPHQQSQRHGQKCPLSNFGANGEQEALVDSGLSPTAQAGTLSNPKNTVTPYAKKHNLCCTVATSVLGLFMGTLVREGPNAGLYMSTGVPTSSLCSHSTLHSSGSCMHRLAGSEPVGLRGMYPSCEKPWSSAGLGGSQRSIWGDMSR